MFHVFQAYLLLLEVYMFHKLRKWSVRKSRTINKNICDAMKMVHQVLQLNMWDNFVETYYIISEFKQGGTSQVSTLTLLPCFRIAKSKDSWTLASGNEVALNSHSLQFIVPLLNKDDHIPESLFFIFDLLIIAFHVD